MIITIDGPAGAGKSSVAKALAKRLRFRFLDTGSMYRAVALAGLRAGVDWSKPEQLARLAETLRIDVDGDRTLLDGEDVTNAVRQSEVTAVTRYAADNVQVRDCLVRGQRELAAGGNIVTEGRDQGTVAFPDANLKIFLTASPKERARRRLQDLRRQGETASLEGVLRQQQRRDLEDSIRPVGPLRKASDAVEVTTDGLSFDAVVDRLVQLVDGKQ